MAEPQTTLPSGVLCAIGQGVTPGIDAIGTVALAGSLSLLILEQAIGDGAECP